MESYYPQPCFHYQMLIDNMPVEDATLNDYVGAVKIWTC